MFYLQPQRRGVVLAEIRPAVERPQDLDTTLGQVSVYDGVPPRIIGWRRDALDAWHLRVQPGDFETAMRLLPGDPLTVRGIAADSLSDDPVGGLPDQVSLNNQLWGGSVTYGSASIADGDFYYPIPDSEQTGWEFTASLSDAHYVNIFFAYDSGTGEGHGVRVTRVGSSLVYAGLNTNVGPTILLYTLATVTYVDGATIGAAWYETTDTEGMQVWLRNGDHWWLDPTHFSMTSVSGGRPQLELTSEAMITWVSCFFSGVANCKYSLPEQFYGPLYTAVGWVDGAWADISERIRIAVERPEVGAERLMRMRYAPVAIQAVTLNGAAATVEQIDGQSVRLSQPISVDDVLEVTYTHQDYGQPYMGCFDSTAGWQDADCNPDHPWSPLYHGGLLYLYLKPTQVELGGETRINQSGSPLYHTSQPEQAGGAQLLAVVGRNPLESPLIQDLRVAPTPATASGTWNPAHSFEGPAQVEGGVLVVQVPPGFSERARDVLGYAVAAGVKTLLKESET